jgi:hypothetical protein
MLKLPNFFLVGAPKAGTTSLYHYLDQHPRIYMSPIKEPHYFSTEIREKNCEPELRRRMARDKSALREYLAGPMREKRFGGIVERWEDYLGLFANAEDQDALGEASVCYLWSPVAPEEIARRLPHARILAMLRDPADRAFSQYLHGVSLGAIRWSFREHIRRNLCHRSGHFCVEYPFLEFGLYHQHLTRYRDRFGANVWVGFYEDFHSRPAEVFQEIYRFLGVATDFSPDMTRRHMTPSVPALGWLKNPRWRQAAAKVLPARLRPIVRRTLTRKPETLRMDPADRQYLIDFYREEIEKLADLVGRDLGKWLQ